MDRNYTYTINWLGRSVLYALQLEEMSRPSHRSEPAWGGVQGDVGEDTEGEPQTHSFRFER